MYVSKDGKILYSIIAAFIVIIAGIAIWHDNVSESVSTSNYDVSDDYEEIDYNSSYSSDTTDYNSDTTTNTSNSNLTLGQQNALDTAENYLSYTAFSYDGIIEQLEYEGYTKEEATYATDNCGADWNEQAAICAKKYLDYSSFSRSGLIDQLEYEGFTSSQAEYGANAVGY